MTKHQPTIDASKIKMPADEFDRMMRQAIQSKPESVPEREVHARPRAKLAKKRAK